ncbi:MAG: patatin-like phospholipase family protein [Nevskia sp.]|nr:patatin-like phospholipase family protein [Nevskia sp.]
MITTLACACSSMPRLSAPPPESVGARPVGFDRDTRLEYGSAETFQSRSAALFMRMREASPDGHINILALSGGGAGGAFGAGTLVGWTQSGQRPVFQLVTGVSVGALIAPYAFLGSDLDPELTAMFSGDASRDLLQRDLINGLFGTSLYRGDRLRALVEEHVTPQMMEAIANEYARGRLLLIETTDLDTGEPVIWNMGAIAARGGERARSLFCKVLIASASIPSVFPPVLIQVEQNGKIYDEMHVDGATSAQLFLAPQIAVMAQQGALPATDVTVYTLVNTQLGRVAKTQTGKTLNVLSVGFDISLTQGTRAALALAYSFAQSHGMRFEVTSIPVAYPQQGPLDFDPDRMHQLFNYAARCAQAGATWKEFEPEYRYATSSLAIAATANPECPARAAWAAMTRTSVAAATP